ncbi:hypothetical protein ACFOOK_28070 [Micromonospora krabiensis]|uniref:Uncharacterized protein n=1 Tax=Micromonospora krabiensis TaxID=307121 RepID=A0A1C3N4R7_9ACTN|nr:hypothetical protein [Micromonospora krabiensis]SBV27574.1 hypothetical protein GA0070620_3098 [Micromonospora krabiensis]
MPRTVKVDLILDTVRYKRGAREAARDTNLVEDAVEDLGKAGAKASKETERLGGGLTGVADDARKLDRQIDTTNRGIRDLARQIAATSDVAERADLAKKLNLERRNLRQQTSLRKLIDFTDEDREQGVRIGARLADSIARGLSTAGGPLTRVLGNVFGTLPPQAQAAIGAGIVGAVAAAAPLIGGALAGAVVGAAGVGGIVGGAAIAARHPAVQASAQQTGDLFMATLGRAGSAFVPAALDGLTRVRGGIRRLDDEFERVGRSASRMVGPLTDDLLEGAESAIEGFATAVERSEPAVRAFGQIGREAGELVGDSLEMLSAHSADAARALLTLWGIVDGGVRILVGAVAGLAATWGWMDKIGSYLRGDLVGLAQLAAEEEAARQGATGLSPALQDLLDSLDGVGLEAGDAAIEVQTLDDNMRTLANNAVSVEQANLRLESAIDAATEAAKRNGAGIDANIPKQNANREALVAIADQANTTAQRILDTGGSYDDAQQAALRGRAGFLAAAEAMKVDSAEAQRLAEKLFHIPDDTAPVVRLVDKATGQLVGFEKRINKLDGRVITVRTRLTSAGEYIPGVGTQTRRWGGITQHAQTGLLRDAQIAAPQGPARYAWAEPATGGEAFIPRLGDVDRSRAIWSYVGRNWLGMGSAATVGTGSPVVNVGDTTVVVEIDGQQLEGRIVSVVRDRDRQLKRRVGAGSGR